MSPASRRIVIIILVVLVVVPVLALIATGVVGIVAAVVVPMYLDARDQPQQQRTLIEMRKVGQALDAHRADKGGYPLVDATRDLVAALGEYGYTGTLQDGWHQPPLKITWLLG